MYFFKFKGHIWAFRGTPLRNRYLVFYENLTYESKMRQDAVFIYKHR